MAGKGRGTIHGRRIPRPGGSRVRHPDRKANPEVDKVFRFRAHSVHRDRCSRTDDTRHLFHVKHAYATAGGPNRRGTTAGRRPVSDVASHHVAQPHSERTPCLQTRT